VAIRSVILLLAALSFALSTAGGIVVVGLSSAPPVPDEVFLVLWWLYLVMSRAVALLLLPAFMLSLPLAFLTNLVIWCLVIVMLLLTSG